MAARSAKSAAIGGQAANPSVSWNFGDGTTAASTAKTGAGTPVSHVYSTPGTYEVVARSGESTFTRTIVVDPPLTASVSSSGGALTASASGGEGSVLAAHWSFDDGSRADGLTVAIPPDGHGRLGRDRRRRRKSRDDDVLSEPQR